ncbi:MAG TPA: TetR/AcrR family transcriptional regulator [Thermoplasmata archaeon]|jgi:AcrR family transcriptional regulator|nr:TetR/AcrR family transcriptional regulator [Thermoplasmata archaeon]
MPKVVPEYKEQARARIVNAAATVFKRKGVPAGTMEDIAREIGVSKGALYLYFPTKTRLLEAIQAKFRAQYIGVLEHRLAHGDVAEGIVDSIEGILTGEFDPAIFHQLVMSAGIDPEVREAMRADAAGDRKELRKLLKHLEGEGRIPRMQDPSATVDAVILLLQGTFMAAALRGDPRESREQLIRAIRLVLGGASPGPARK